jgi:hypothetical protein
MLGVKIGAHFARCWLFTISGSRAQSASNAMVANSPVFWTCTPLLLVSVTCFGSQSSGSSGSMPAPMMWIQRSFGAAAARVFCGKTLSVMMSLPVTSPSAVASQPRS